MREYFDIVGGIGSPFLDYRVTTGDPAEPGRSYISAKTTDEPAVLYNPLSRCRTSSWWDDRGEAHPFDAKGPDLIISVNIPKGIYRLALYMREHRIAIMDKEDRLLVSVPRRKVRGDAYPDTYQCFVVFGPIQLKTRIFKDNSLCTLLKGVFLDKISPPLPLPENLVSLDSLSKTLAKSSYHRGKNSYYKMLEKWQQNPASYFAHVAEFKKIISYLREFLNTSPNSLSALWLIWQSRGQLIGEFRNQESDFLNFVSTYMGKEGIDKTVAFLRNLAESLFKEEGNLRDAQLVLDAYIRLETEHKKSLEMIEQIIEEQWDYNWPSLQIEFGEWLSTLRSAENPKAVIADIIKLARKYFDQKRYPLSEIAYKEAVRRQEGCLSPEDQLNLARSCEYQNRLDEAIKIYQKLLEYSGSALAKDQLYYSLIQCYVRLREFSKAAAIGKEFLNRCPSSQYVEDVKELLKQIRG